MPKVTLVQVASEAMKNKEFFEALVRNPDEALKARDYSLSEGDLATLKRLLQPPPPTVKFDVPKFVRSVQERGLTDGVDWTGIGVDWTDIPFKR